MRARSSLAFLLSNRRLRERWQVRAVLWAAAGAAGLAVVGFAMLAERALALFEAFHQRWPWAPFVLAPLLGMGVVWATRRFVPGAAGSGIPQVVAATKLAALGRPVEALLAPRVAAAKVLLGSLALVGGFSAGREGPSVQVAASVLHLANRFLPNGRALRASDLILAGGAAGIAAAFNTPLAGIVFAVEELGRRLESRTSGVLVSTIIISGLVAIALKGNYDYFGQLTLRDLGSAVLLPTLIAGVLCGGLGGLFSWLLLWPQRRPELVLWAWRRAHPVRFAGMCGLVVAVLGWVSGGTSFGSGYSAASQAIGGQLVLAWHAPLTRFAATLATYFSGLPGGIFAPSLAVGTAIGSDLARWVGLGVDPHAWIALCMAAFLAAVTQSPITAAIIVMEMAGGHQMVISLMAVAFLSKSVSARFGPELYQQLAMAWMTPAAVPPAARPALDAPARTPGAG
ncbi:MAG TPA: chloride channel protein [Burkholderiaceae bacterium]|nr:chloride channel protein [Burkholderiaceae bacterium]